MKNEDYWQGYTDACREIVCIIEDKHKKVSDMIIQKRRLEDDFYFKAEHVIYFLRLMIREIVEHRKAKMKGD